MKPIWCVIKMFYLKILGFYVAVLGIMVVSVISGWALTDRSTEHTYGTPPGVEKFNTDLLSKFEKMRGLSGKDYQPRTRHKPNTRIAFFLSRVLILSSILIIQSTGIPGAMRLLKLLKR